ncbi:uncharacterized protein DFL_002730 [Arthrobotrys flagrans]|uniref:Uncharacterized protein n=1 Tax=Arthrobotrys flagrans TaxID=97331 RepID=A0A437ABQ2_ARTFL|nr:hypothetical protein DFL_002730 [Arthrobotrys flagrans]
MSKSNFWPQPLQDWQNQLSRLELENRRRLKYKVQEYQVRLRTLELDYLEKRKQARKIEEKRRHEAATATRGR